MDPKFKKGETIEVEYTIADADDVTLDLERADIAALGAKLYKKRNGTTGLLIKTYSTAGGVDVGTVDITSGAVNVVIDPTTSETLESGRYYLEFFVNFTKTADPQFPDNVDTRVFNVDTVNFEIV